MQGAGGYPGGPDTEDKPHHIAASDIPGLEQGAVIVAATSSCYDNCYDAAAFGQADVIKPDADGGLSLYVASTRSGRIQLHITVLYYVP